MPYKPTGRPPGRPRHPEPLTPAEQRVLRYLRQGKTNAEIAGELDVSPDAVKYHVSNMLGKLELESREQLAAWREPSPVARVWAAIGGLGWKVAGGAGALVGVLVGLTVLLSVVPIRFVADKEESSAELTVLDPGPGRVLQASLSSDGRWVAYVSAPPTETAPPSGNQGVYLLDRSTGQTVLASRAISGDPNGASSFPTISADGRFVAFQSVASNLVAGDTNGDPTEVESRLPDSMIGSITRVTGSSREWFMGDIGGSDIFLFDRESGTVSRLSISTEGEQGNWGSRRPSVSADGGLVAFESLATNLVPSDTNFGRGSTKPFPLGGSDIFVRDIRSGTTTRVSIAHIADEAQGSSAEPFISASGQAVSFISDALNFPAGSHSVMKGYLRDDSSETRLISVPLSGSEIPQHSVDTAPRISSDGNLVLFAAVNYWNHRSGVYLYDRGSASTIELWSEDSEAWSQYAYHATMSADGTKIGFVTPGQVVWLYDPAKRRQTPVTAGLQQVMGLSLSDAGDVLILSERGAEIASPR